MLGALSSACGGVAADSERTEPTTSTPGSPGSNGPTSDPSRAENLDSAIPTITSQSRRSEQPTSQTGSSRARAGTAPAASRRAATGEQVTAVGDSVMVATAPNLEALLPGIAIDAVVGRGVDDGLSALQSYADRGLLRDRVVFELGTNSPFSVDQFDQLVRTAGGRRLVVVTNHCDRCNWTVSNNAVLQRNCDVKVRCAIADWESVAQQNPQFFAGDGIHVAGGGDGAQALAELIVTALG